MTIEGSTYSVWIFEMSRETLTRFSFFGDEWKPIWTTDGKKIIYTSTVQGKRNLYWKSADGAGTEERLTNSEKDQQAWSVSPDGRLLAYLEGNLGFGEAQSEATDIWILPLQGNRQPWPFLQTSFNETRPKFAPDGRWIAYTSNESGRSEVYVQAFPGPGSKWQISTEGGDQLRWSRQGDELFYRNGNKMMAVRIDTGSGFNASSPTTLFEGSYILEYDVAPDGQRFLMIKDAKQDALREIIVVKGWRQELQQKVGHAE